MKMMRNGSAAGHSKRRALLALSLTLVVLCIAVGGTIAWLKDATGTITNTFSPTKIDIELNETTTGYKMIPGTEISKNPKVKVLQGSEACWLFVKVEESADLGTFIDYVVRDGDAVAPEWAELSVTPGVDGVKIYYREVEASTGDQTFGIIGYMKNGTLQPDKVLVKNVTEEQMKNKLPTLEFTAYAIQKDGFGTAAAAWTQITTPATP